MYTHLLHLPILTFPPHTQAFKTSLRGCASACRDIITLFSTHKTERRLFYLQPNGTRLLFQSALMCLFESWHDNPPDLNISPQQIVGTVIELLELQKLDWETSASVRGDGNGDRERWVEGGVKIISTSITTLQRLVLESIPEERDIAMAGVLSTPLVEIEEVSEGWQQPSALEQLNRMDGLGWDFSTPLEDRSGLISFYLA